MRTVLTSLALWAIAAAGAASAPPKTDAIVVALAAGDWCAFAEIAGDARLLRTPAFGDVVEHIERYENVVISAHHVERVRADERSMDVELSIDGKGDVRYRPGKAEAIPSRWHIGLERRGSDWIVVSVETAEGREARAFIRAPAWQPITPSLAAIVLREARQHDRALVEEAATELLARSLAAHDRRIEAYAWCTLAAIESEPQRADRFAAAALGAALAVEDCDLIALARYATSDNDPGVGEQLDLAAADLDSLDDPRIALRALDRRARSALVAFDISGASVRYERLQRESGHRWKEGEVRALRGRQSVSGALNDLERVIRFGEAAAVVAQEIADPESEMRALNNTGRAYANEGNPRAAIRLLRRGLELVSPDDAAFNGYLNANLAVALWTAKQYAEATDAADEAVQFTANGPEGRTFALMVAMEISRAAGRFEEAITRSREVLRYDQGSVWLMGSVRRSLGEMLVECGRIDEGLAELQAALATNERRLSLTVTDRIGRARSESFWSAASRSLARALFLQGNAEEALAVVESVRAQVLSQSSRNADAITLRDDDRRRQRELNDRVVELNRRVIAVAPKEREAVRKELVAARRAFDEFSADLPLRYLSAIERRPEPLDLNAAAGALGGNVIVEYFADGLEILVFVVKDGRATAYRVAASEEDVVERVRTLQRQIGRRDLGYAGTARELYDLLIGPFAAQLKDGTAITFIPDGALWDVPFEVLLDRSRRALVDTHPIAYSHSVARLVEVTRRSRTIHATHELLALADPRSNSRTLGALPDAAEEVRRVADLYPEGRSNVYVGQRARETTFKRIAGEFRVIHLATHGFVEEDAPLYSGLLLAATASDPDDGVLEAREISALDLSADLVVLSACDTARGPVYSGEGVVGLAWAFLSSGARNVVVSRWQAESRATSQLMVAFHRHLAAGSSPSEALRFAQLELRRDERFNHPFYWAPFMVVGAGSAR